MISYYPEILLHLIFSDHLGVKYTRIVNIDIFLTAFGVDDNLRFVTVYWHTGSPIHSINTLRYDERSRVVGKYYFDVSTTSFTEGSGFISREFPPMSLAHVMQGEP